MSQRHRLFLGAAYPKSQIVPLWSDTPVAQDGSGNLPAGQQDGDCLIALTQRPGDSVAPGLAPGWITPPGGLFEVTGGPSVRIAYQFRDGADITDTGVFPNAVWVGVLAYRGLKASDPIAVDLWNHGNSSSVPMPVPAWTGAAADWGLDLIVISPANVITAAPGMTERFSRTDKRMSAADAGPGPSLITRSASIAGSPVDWTATTLRLRSA